MELKVGIIAIVFVIFTIFPINIEGGLKRCYVCRSRGENGSCKDPFTLNATQADEEKGVDTIPCASGWCGKIVETENALKEEYGVATQRICLQRGPSDSEDRCGQTKWQYRPVLMCFCKGDLCNDASTVSLSAILLGIAFFTIRLI
ncbi:PREDICTED: uncharacterized protein LOC108565170 [Nicrophorus vespilloides]|uniref:Uncharacterized protein LOC108565170 n=1 Tax=Nicrophorus vespilloides TaxID=110193 RepID=A0ABM1MZH4_NICVS|nr:PREDICTED: uncharacterized protein LOC108565170 [Nicrophorus vespilloides]